MMTLDQAEAGRRVRYTSTSGETIEEGVITSVNEDYVFVRYDKRIKPNVQGVQPHSATAADSPGVATDPANLEFI